jgi:hypothetical protein
MALTPEPDDAAEFSSMSFDQMRVDPFYHTDDQHTPSPIWAESQILRELLDKRGTPSLDDRRRLSVAVPQQQASLGVYRMVSILRLAKISDPSASKPLSLYVVLFPGEGKDNTGIKDLNDKVLGYDLNNQFIVERQKAIATIFWQPDGYPPPNWVTVGQDYKTAYIMPNGKTRKDFAADLIKLDAVLRDKLLAFLKIAQDTVKDDKKQAEIKKLKKILEKDKNYRFGYLYGVSSIAPAAGEKCVDTTYRLITEALKGAGIARFGEKGKTLKTTDASKIAKGKGITKPPKGEDARGQPFDGTTYLRVTRAADDVKKLMTTPNSRDRPAVNDIIYVNTVWIPTFLLHQRRYFGNPDVIRDIRKKVLVDPPLKAGIKYNVKQQRELLELWLVTLNMMDFVKDFLFAEFRSDLLNYHDMLLAILEELQIPDRAIHWDRLEKALTRDLRQMSDRLTVLGTTSEFQFYAFASDYADRIFFTMDVRDLGVDLMAYYEAWNELVQDDKLQGTKLVEATLQSTDDTVARKRFTYYSVVAVFKKYFAEFQKTNAPAIALKSFGTTLHLGAPVSEFEKSIQIMLGGDEVFVAAHPYYAKFATQIIAELDAIQFTTQYGTQALNMRVGVVYSSASWANRPNTGAVVSDEQRLNNQIAHDKAMRLAAEAHGLIKPFERINRRIELLIDKLEANDKKKQLAPDYRKKLEDLHLMKLYARAKFMHAMPLSDAAYNRLLKQMQTGDLKGAKASGLFDLVDFTRKEVDGDKLAADAGKLEDAVRNDVGLDNVHIAPPPVTKIPKWIQKLIDKVLPPEKTP